MEEEIVSLVDELEKFVNKRGYVAINDLNDFTRSLKHKKDGVWVRYKISNGERRLRQLAEEGKIERVPKDPNQYVKGYKALGYEMESEPTEEPKSIQPTLSGLNLPSQRPLRNPYE